MPRATMMRKLGMTLVVVSFLLAGLALAQDSSPRLVTVTNADRAATATNFKYHARPANNAAGRAMRAASVPKTLTAASIPGLPAPGYYPADLTYFGGPVVKNMVSHDVFIDCNESCWGDPGTFLKNLGLSNFIHLTDQYVGTTANNRYTLGFAASVQYPIPTGVIGQSDLLVILHAVASSLKETGYGHEYHLYLPKGVDTCFDLTNICYSPDNPSTFFFCAYHGSVDFSDIGHVLVSVEPYQNVGGCSVDPNHSPNGLLVDSTSNVLSHELIETITDPDPQNYPFKGAGWVAVSSLIEFGAEIGDICENAFFSYVPVSLNGRKYEIQPEYSNKYHGCSFVP